MCLRRFRTIVVWQLVLAACVLTLVSCGHSPTAPDGQVLVYVAENGAGPAPGKTIEILGTSLSQATDAHGIALFSVPAGTHVVRAYQLGTPGPGRLYVEQSVEVRSARTSRVEFNDCTMCR